LKTDDGKIHILRLDDGSLRCLANSRDDFADKLEDDETANDWLMVPLVDRLMAIGKVLKSEQCYAFSKPPILGGDYTVDNVCIRSVASQYAIQARFFEKLEGVPDGARVEYETGDEKTG